MFEDVGKFRESDFSADWRERFVQYFERRIAEGSAYYALAQDGETCAGTAGALLSDGFPYAIHGLRNGYIFGVRVAPAYRGRGIGTRLTQSALGFLETKQCHRIRLHASPFGKPIYERIGFVPTNEMELR